jgi:signal transduction histidine kinase
MQLRPRTIRAQILTAIGAIVLWIIVVLVVLTLYFAQHQLYDLGERDMRAQVEALAARAGFATIVGADSPDIAKELMKESIGVNGIRAAELVSLGGDKLASLEESTNLLSGCGFATPHVEAGTGTIVKRLPSFWCVSALIIERSNSGACSAAPCVVGHLRIVASTASVDMVVRRLIEAILSVGFVLLAVAIFFLWMVSATIVSPLRAIVSVMRRFAAGDRDARAIERGPDEAKTISRVYNELIEAQEEQARNLERTVEQRTLELKDATLAAQDAERYKTTFMANISHDMRTPLHVIRSQATEVMNELEFGGDAGRAREHVDIIMRECTELSLRVAQVLELTRGDTGHANLELGIVSIDMLRKSVLDKAEALAKQNCNKLMILADPGTVLTDGDKVLQIMTNLIENACKFTTEGTVEVRLRLQDNEFHISVTDSGVGIPEGQIAHIWSEFRQALFSGGRRAGGFGLGLAIVRQYTALLGGRYGAESTEGYGTTVWVILPANGASALNASTSDGLSQTPN